MKNKSKTLIDSRTTDFMHAKWNTILFLCRNMKSDNLLLAKRIENFSAYASKRLIWQITGVVPEKLIVFYAVGLSIANLRFPRAVIYERIEFKPAWPTFRRSFQALSIDTDRRNTPRSVWRPSHRTGFSIFTRLFFVVFRMLLYANSKYSQN